MKGALDIHRELLACDVPHEIVRLPRMILHADELPDALGLSPTYCVVVRVYVADGRLVTVMMPAGQTPDPAALLGAVGAGTLHAATGEEVNAATDYAAGLVAPLLLPAALPLLADASLRRPDVLYTSTGDTGTALGIHSADLLSISGAQIVDVTRSAAIMIDITESASEFSG